MKFHGTVEAIVRMKREIEAPDIDTANIRLKREAKTSLEDVEGVTRVLLEHVSVTG